ncbi:MAG TPA: lytic transglycosylase domain-containing protein, partial [Sphingorhabdus sp.]|nr:lytic transglycosylase domain-containing protein [Sphingorhabdus sp.]
MVKHLISASLLSLPLFTVAATAQQPVIFTPGTGGTAIPGQSAPPAPRVAAPAYDPSEGNIPAALQRWKMLGQSNNYAFGDYATFLMAYPDWPGSEDMRRNAENAISPLTSSPNQVVAYFDRLTPLTNSGRAKFAIALDASGDRTRAVAVAREAWRGGVLSDDEEARLVRIAGNQLTATDHDARVDRLLWSSATTAASRWVAYTSPARRPAFYAALATRSNSPDSAMRVQEAGASANAQASLLAARVDALRTSGNSFAARELLANRANLVTPAPVLKDWYKLLLTHAQAAANDGQHDVAYRIASRIDDAASPGLVMVEQDLTTRDRYTSLAWLAGTTALDKLGRPRDAVTMFGRYTAAAKSPQTRSKGLYWAGKAAARAGDAAGATRFYEQASAYYDTFFGQLSLEQLRRPLPPVPGTAISPPTIADASAPAVYRAAALATKYASWKDQSNFLRAISASARTAAEFVNAIALSKKIGRPDLAVMAGRNARYYNHAELVGIGYPTVNVPASQSHNWTLNHAIMRQESQFDRAAVSHAGARGLMQLMPGTARETSGKVSMAYR